MKRTIAWILAALMLFTLCACAAKPADDAQTPADTTTADNAPADNSTDNASTDGKTIKIGLAMPTAQEEIWVTHGNLLTQYAEELGWEVILQVANGDTDKQFSQVENMLTSGIDVLVLAACDPGSTGKVVKAAADEGVIVIGYDRVNSADPYSLYLTFDNVAVGRLMAEYAVAQAPTGNYTLLGGDVVNQPATDEIHSGWMEVLQPYVDKGDITIVADQNCKNWASDEGLAHCENALTAANNEMAAVLCANDGIAGGAIQALDSAGLAGTTIVTAQDSEVAAAQRILAGTQSITEYKPAAELAKAAIDSAAKLLAGEQLENLGDYEGIPMITLLPTVVSKDNLDAALIDSGYMTHEAVYGN